MQLLKNGAWHPALSDRLSKKFLKICLFCTYVDQMIIQQIFDVLLQLQFYNIFTNIIFITFKRFHQYFKDWWTKIHNKITKYTQTLVLIIFLYQVNPMPHLYLAFNYTSLNFTENVPEGTKDSFAPKSKKSFVELSLKK